MELEICAAFGKVAVSEQKTIATTDSTAPSPPATSHPPSKAQLAPAALAEEVWAVEFLDEVVNFLASRGMAQYDVASFCRDFPKQRRPKKEVGVVYYISKFGHQFGLSIGSSEWGQCIRRDPLAAVCDPLSAMTSSVSSVPTTQESAPSLSRTDIDTSAWGAATPWRVQP